MAARKAGPPGHNRPCLYSLSKADAVHFTVYTRALIPTYFYRRSVLAWQCSVCRRMFSLTVDEAERETGAEPPPHIRREFRLHNCALALDAALEHQR